RPRLGAVSFLHRFGSALNHHVHLHACATDGVFVPTGDGPPALLRASRLPKTAAGSTDYPGRSGHAHREGAPSCRAVVPHTAAPRRRCGRRHDRSREQWFFGGRKRPDYAHRPRRAELFSESRAPAAILCPAAQPGQQSWASRREVARHVIDNYHAHGNQQHRQGHGLRCNRCLRRLFGDLRRRARTVVRVPVSRQHLVRSLQLQRHTSGHVRDSHGERLLWVAHVRQERRRLDRSVGESDDLVHGVERQRPRRPRAGGSLTRWGGCG
ncbi:MAG: hypothetical protein DWI27_00450, partial [Planctomycetota bacterium]